MEYEGLCGNCKYLRDTDKYGGKCYRYPPAILQDLRQDFNGDYLSQMVQERPYVELRSWCGEQQGRDDG